MAALSLATDLRMGQPLEQALRTCLIALRLAALANLPADEMPAVYYGALLRFLGCTAESDRPFVWRWHLHDRSANTP